MDSDLANNNVPAHERPAIEVMDFEDVMRKHANHINRALSLHLMYYSSIRLDYCEDPCQV